MPAAHADHFRRAVIFLLVTIANFTKNEWLIRAASLLNPGAANPWPYALAFFALILGFATSTHHDGEPDRHRLQFEKGWVHPGGASRQCHRHVSLRCPEPLTSGGSSWEVAIILAAVERATTQTFQGLGATSLLILVWPSTPPNRCRPT